MPPSVACVTQFVPVGKDTLLRLIGIRDRSRETVNLQAFRGIIFSGSFWESEGGQRAKVMDFGVSVSPNPPLQRANIMLGDAPLFLYRENGFKRDCSVPVID